MDSLTSVLKLKEKGVEIYFQKENILFNEKYQGEVYLQKIYIVDFIPEKRKANKGVVLQYYVEGSNDTIIKSDEW